MLLVLSQEADRQTLVLSSLSYLIWDPARGMVPPTFAVGLPSSVTPNSLTGVPEGLLGS